MTAVGCGAWALGLLDPVSRFGLDLHFRHLGTIDADSRIVLIDINDHALSEVHGWPWPRRLHAQLVETLDELNAQAIVLDIGFFESLAESLGQSPDKSCPGDFSTSADVLADKCFSSGQIRDAKLVFIRYGAYCDCQVLESVCPALAELHTSAV